MNDTVEVDQALGVSIVADIDTNRVALIHFNSRISNSRIGSLSNNRQRLTPEPIGSQPLLSNLKVIHAQVAVVGSKVGATPTNGVQVSEDRRERVHKPKNTVTGCHGVHDHAQTSPKIALLHSRSCYSAKHYHHPASPCGPGWM